MLVVSRRRGQRVLLGDDIVVVVNEVARGVVKLGISAPARCSIVRGEIHDAVEKANRDALLTSVEAAELAVRGAR